MSLSRRDIEKIDSDSFKEPPFTGFFVGIIRLLQKIPPIRKYMSESYGGLLGTIFRCWDKHEYEKATHTAIFCLKKYRNHKSKFVPAMDHHYWWSFMKHGVDSAKHIDNETLKENIMDLARSGIKPFEGYDAAYSFLEFSRWKYQEKNETEALEYASLASKADITWAEPDFLLGWYSLIFGHDGAEMHFAKAVEKDQRVLFRIANNEVCKQYPHIINKLKSQYSSLGVTESPNKKRQSDA